MMTLASVSAVIAHAASATAATPRLGDGPAEPTHPATPALDASNAGPGSSTSSGEPAGGRILAETGLGLLGGVAGVVGGSLIYYGVASAAGCAGGDFCSYDAVGVAALVTSPFAIAAGVTLGGEVAGGRGNYGWALLGTSAGAALGAPLFAVAPTRESEGGGAGELVAASSVAMGLLAVAGGVVFYELFADESPQPAPSASRLALAPVSSVGPTGFTVGLAVRF
jgi:hypothetical protein